MRRFDLLDEYSTLIAPPLAPQARPRPLRSGARRWPAPVAVLALGCILLAALWGGPTDPLP